MKIVNLTPHTINILNEQEEVMLIVRPSGKVARLDSDKEIVGKSSIPGILFFHTKFGIPYLAKYKDGKEIGRCQLPEQKNGVIYIVSGLFRSGCNRVDLWQPGELVLDKDGQPIGCIGLSQ